jgi:hypothetical protein
VALNVDISLQVKAFLSTPTDLAQATAPHILPFATTWASGVAANQADLVWGDERSIAASGTDDLDLAGSLTGALGGTITFAKVKGIFVTASAANTNKVVVGAAAATQFVGPFGANTHTLAVDAGGFFATATPLLAGWGVTATTADLLRVANSAAGTAVVYRILLIGTSA